MSAKDFDIETYRAMSDDALEQFLNLGRREAESDPEVARELKKVRTVLRERDSYQKVEDVAKAIHDADLYSGAWDDYDTWTVDTEKQHESYRRLARAAIQAMEDYKEE